MKAEVDKKCACLTNEIAVDEWRRADLQKKRKEATNKIHAEKNVMQNNVDPMMKDSRKLKLELSKIKNDAVKQAMVLEGKIDEAAHLELEKRLNIVEQMWSVLLAQSGVWDWGE